jgi:uncharacterized protein (DUF2147 family)
MHAPCRAEAIVRKLLILLPALLALTGAGGSSESPEGYWLTAKKDGIIQILRCGEAWCGKLAWFRIAPNDPNPQALDLHNPDPARRDRSLCGLTFMSGFKAGGPGSWEDGAIYDPESGNTYHATIKLRTDGTLDLHGYIGISLFGRSEVWTRYTQPVPTCPTR